MPEAATALPGRDITIEVPDRHYVNGNPLKPPFPSGMEQRILESDVGKLIEEAA